MEILAEYSEFVMSQKTNTPARCPAGVFVFDFLDVVVKLELSWVRA